MPQKYGNRRSDLFMPTVFLSLAEPEIERLGGAA